MKPTSDDWRQKWVWEPGMIAVDDDETPSPETEVDSATMRVLDNMNRKGYDAGE